MPQLKRLSPATLVCVCLSLCVLLLAALPQTRPFGVGLVGLSLYVALVIFSLGRTSLVREWRSTNRRARVATVLVGGLFALFTLGYIGSYHFYPTWDSIGYWKSTLDFNRSLDVSELDTLSSMLSSVGAQDYNLLICWVVSSLVRLFPTWQGTFASITVVFVIPSAFVMALFASSWLSRLGEENGSRSWRLPVLFACTLLFPTLMRPSFTGLIDAPALLVLLCALALLYEDSLPESPLTAATGGICLVVSFLLRRYFLFAAVGVAAGVTLRWLVAVAMTDSVERARLFRRLLVALASVLLVVAVSAIAFPGFYLLSLFGDQGDAYAAWNVFGSVLERVDNVCLCLGWLWIGLMFVSVVSLAVAVVHRVAAFEGARDILVCSGSLLVSVVTTLVAFWGIQDLSIQHWYIFLGQIEIAIHLSILGALLVWFRVSRTSLAAGVLLAAFSALGFANAFGLLASYPSLESALGHVLSPVLMRPQIQGDYDEKSRMVDDLTTLTGGTEVVYFAAASPDLNSSLPLSTVMPESTVSPFPCAYADADSRDGFNTQFFDSSYVVTSDPVALHLLPENERVVVTLNDLVSDGDSFIGSHYRPVDTYSFDGDVTVTVYELVTPFSSDDVRQLEALFDEMYPDNPELFHDRFEAYLEEHPEI